jgi:hypothetical protein
MITILVIMVSLTTIVKAETTEKTGDVNMTITMDSVIKNTKTLTATVALGTFEGVTESQPMAYEMTLDYDTELITGVQVKGLNNWNASYNDSTKRLLGDVDQAKSNQKIAEITFTLAENISVGTKLEIKFNQINIANDDTLDQTFSLTQQATITDANDGTETNTTNSTNETINSTTNTIVTQNTIDSTIAKTPTLPKAGVSHIILIAIVVISLVGIGFMIRSKSIKLK